MQYTLPSDGTTSEMFWDAQYRTYGGVYIECQCGITHYAVESRYIHDWYDDKVTVPPETQEGDYKVQHHHDCDSVAHFAFIGRQFVYGCDGCSKYLRK